MKVVPIVNAAKKNWHAVDATVVRAASEAIEYGLMEAGAEGTETNELDSTKVVISGYFDTAPAIDIIRPALLEALRIYSLESSALMDLTTREVPDRDWLAEWKRDWQPVQVGRFIITPPWSEITGDHIVIRIEPGMAFGTGTHETTRLCLKAIEKHFRGGSFLDVGTGTGILAMAAARLFPEAHIEAVDTDPEAIEIARENARLNEVADRIAFKVGSVSEQTSSADLICANLTAPVIVELLPLLLGATCGRLVLSGILAEQSDLVRSRLLELGTDNFATEQDGEWIALVV
ncbi:MAG TPA: 50S ribosomal protein L11 methyltransferase [Pyrinomonadaceae bacterium]|nr:50S ribosomal protein L11 methyltransferase [Pyrinomonadaceae bacterium]